MKRLLVIVFLLGWVLPSFAEVPKLISYSGKLTDKKGVAVSDKDYDMRFSLWTAFSGGTEVWFEEHYAAQSRAVPVSGGAFNVTLGSYNPVTPMTRNYFIEVRAIIKGTFQTFGRQQILSVPYALRADDGIPRDAIILWTGCNCPDGYRRLNELDGLFPRGADTYSAGYAGGNDTHNHSGVTGVGGGHNHLISDAEIPHDSGGAALDNSNWYRMGSVNSMVGRHKHEMSAAPDHTHGINASSSLPRYFNVIFCLKE